MTLAVGGTVPGGRALPTVLSTALAATTTTATPTTTAFAALLAATFGGRVRRLALGRVLERSRFLGTVSPPAALALARRAFDRLPLTALAFPGLTVCGLPLAATFAAAIAFAARLR